MAVISLLWLCLVIIWRFAYSEFPDINDVVIVKYKNNIMKIDINLNIKIHCTGDPFKVLYASKFVNCTAKNFHVIYKSDIGINVSYNIDRNDVSMGMKIYGYKTVIYDGYGNVVQTFKTRQPFEGINKENISYNTKYLRCIVPIIQAGQYYLYRCWAFLLNEPISFLGIKIYSFEEFRLNKIFWKIKHRKRFRYFIKTTNLINKLCFSNRNAIKDPTSTPSDNCTAAKIQWHEFNTIELLDLDPISTYEVRITPLNSRYNSSYIVIKTPYGSKREKCFADCIFKLHDGSIKYTGIRQVNSAGKVCDETCSTKQFPDRLTCPRYRVHFDCDIPFCTFNRSTVASCPSVISTRYLTYWNIDLSSLSNQRITGFILLVYEKQKCEKAVIVTEGHQEFSMYVKSFFLACSKITKMYELQYHINKQVSVVNTDACFVIPIINVNETGFVQKIVYDKKKIYDCFQDCNSVSYRGIRSAVSFKGACEKWPEISEHADQGNLCRVHKMAPSCFINGVITNCSVPQCILSRENVNCVTESTAEATTNNIFVEWSAPITAERLTGYLILLYNSSNFCIRAKLIRYAIKVQVPDSVKEEIYNFMESCRNKKTIVSDVLNTKFSNLLPETNYTVYIIPVPHAKRLGFVKRLNVQTEAVTPDSVVYRTKRNSDNNKTDENTISGFQDDAKLNAFYISLVILLSLGLITVVVAIIIFLIRLYIRLRAWKIALTSLQEKSARFLTKTKKDSLNKGHEGYSLVDTEKKTFNSETTDDANQYLKLNHIEEIMDNPTLVISSGSSD